MGDAGFVKIVLNAQTGLRDGCEHISVCGLSADSREIRPGYLFAALSGTQVNGAAFIGKAVGNGARAVLVQRDEHVEVPEGVQVLRVDDPRRALALIAAQFYNAQPDCVAAVTGTNGKSSVVAFVRQIWDAMGLAAASLGTVGVSWPGGFEKLAHTTPDPVGLQRTLKDLHGHGVSHLALEASSHGLEQHRLDGIKICVAAYTNFSRDHLDYHKTFEAYFDAKMRLLEELLCPRCVAVVNADDARAPDVIRRVKESGRRVYSVGRKGRDLKLLTREPLGLGQVLKIRGSDQDYKVFLPLVGDFQASNALVAAGMVVAAGGSEAVAVRCFENLKGARGRLELVARSATDAAIFVDFAHTPDALDVALSALRSFVENRLVVVFGCGGDRDKTKRPLMGEVAQRLADVVIVSDDNPRTEEAGQIRREVLKGCPGALEIGDRGKAISDAVAMLDKGDVLLVAGKGHEEGQIIGTKTIAFSDHEAVLAAVGGKAA